AVRGDYSRRVRALHRCCYQLAIHALLPLALLASPGCASLPPPVARQAEHALADPQDTALGENVLAVAPTPDASGFRVLQAGEDAFVALGVLIDRAQQTLDLQYYLVRDEESSRTLLARVYKAAAERHVKVRLLVDDLNTASEEDLLLCVANQSGI